MLNKIVLMGRLTRDPELRRTGSGTAVSSFSLAVDRDFKSQSGEKETDFIDIVAWRNTAEFVSKYFTKGRMAIVEGRLQIRDWMVKPLMDAGVRPEVIDVAAPYHVWVYGNLFSVSPVPLVHDVLNCGWKITEDRERAFYATDTGTLDHISAPGYDLYLIEANHTRAEIETRIAEKEAAGEFAYESRAMANHLSREQALDWLSVNMGPNSRYVFLHQHVDKEAKTNE